MLALTVAPGSPRSARIEEFPDPSPAPDQLLIQAIALGICGTDIEILNGMHGEAAAGSERLVLGHESLGRVLQAPPESGFNSGDHVVGIVRRPDPVPCPNCAHGEWDMCSNGLYTERGIKGQDGYGSEKYLLEPAFAVRVDPALGLCAVLLEPASIIAKAWRQIEQIGARAHWRPSRVLVTGAGPIGLLAALMTKQRGLELHVLDLIAEGPRPLLIADLGGTFHTGSLADLQLQFDVIIECTGAGQVVIDSIAALCANGILCLTGLSSRKRTLPVNMAEVNRSLVLENQVVVGSVNASRRDYEAAAAALSAADRSWLARMISIRAGLKEWSAALYKKPGDIKAVIEFSHVDSA